MVPAFDAGRRRDSDLELNCKIVENWSILFFWFSLESRDENDGHKEAEDLYTAISDPAHGVLQFIKLVDKHIAAGKRVLEDSAGVATKGPKFVYPSLSF